MSVTGLMSMMTKRMWSPISSRRFLEKATFSRTNCLMDSMLAKKMGAAGQASHKTGRDQAGWQAGQQARQQLQQAAQQQRGAAPPSWVGKERPATSAARPVPPSVSSPAHRRCAA